MHFSDDLPWMRDLPRAPLPTDERLILASGSPRRAELLAAAGYEFQVEPASETAECGVCSRETAAERVARYAYRKAADVVSRHTHGLILAADTLTSCQAQILGKPHDRDHAEAMLRLLSGKTHDVYTGICLWSAASSRCVLDVVATTLHMQPLSEAMLSEYLDSMLWEGKAGAFGYQDSHGWLRVLDGGCESNVVGLPMPRLAELLENFDSSAETVTTGTLDPPPKP